MHLWLQNNSSLTRVVNTRIRLSNKCMTKDFLRDFHHGYTVHGEQEDHTFNIQVQVDMYRYSPVMIHVILFQLCKTQDNLVFPGFSKFRTESTGI